MAGYRLHERLGFRVSRLARLLQVRHEAALSADGLTRLGAAALMGVGVEGVGTPSDLASYLGITRPAMSRLLRGLEGKGFVLRAPASGDGRQTAVVLTAAGQDVLLRVRAASDALQAHFAAKLTPDDLALLTDALSRLAEGEPDPTNF